MVGVGGFFFLFFFLLFYYYIVCVYLNPTKLLLLCVNVLFLKEVNNIFIILIDS